MIRVILPTQLRSYTGGRAEIEVTGDSVAAALAALDTRFPGIRFRVVDEQDRIREHMRIFVNQDRAHDLAAAVRDGDEVMIFGALTGGTNCKLDASKRREEIAGGARQRQGASP